MTVTYLDYVQLIAAHCPVDLQTENLHFTAHAHKYNNVTINTTMRKSYDKEQKCCCQVSKGSQPDLSLIVAHSLINPHAR